LVTAVQIGLLDSLPPDAIAGFREGLGDMLDRDAAEAVATLQRNGAVAGPSAQAFTAALTHYTKSFLTSPGGTP
jgi:F-type H+-transporting ATPase subunit alpha